MKPAYYSFDVFDTLLTRNVLYPRDIFLLMQERFAQDAQALPSGLIRSFWGERVWSEFVARRMTRQEDVSFEDIYRVLARRHWLTRTQQEELMAAELATESAMLVPVNGAIPLVEGARQAKCQIIFVSDMYLPSGFISEILARYGLFIPGDRVYVSGEVGKTKGSGSLFRHILADLEIAPAGLVHYGDNPHADWYVPTMLGIVLLKGADVPAVSSGRLSGTAAYFKDLLRARLQIAGVIDV